MEPPPSNILMGEQRAKFQPKTLFWNHQGFPVEPLISAVNDSRFLDLHKMFGKNIPHGCPRKVGSTVKINGLYPPYCGVYWGFNQLINHGS